MHAHTHTHFSASNHPDQPVAMQIDRRSEFDQVVIETTGLANPASIIKTFSLINEVWENMALDAVVTLVDAKHVERQLAEERAEGADNEALQQIAYADRIVLNKTDLVSSLGQGGMQLRALKMLSL